MSPIFEGGTVRPDHDHRSERGRHRRVRRRRNRLRREKIAPQFQDRNRGGKLRDPRNEYPVDARGWSVGRISRMNFGFVRARTRHFVHRELSYRLTVRAQRAAPMVSLGDAV